MRNPAFCICENKDADQLHGNHKPDQRLCFRNTDSAIPLLPKIRNFKHLAIFCDCIARFVSDLVGNPKDRFSHNEAHIGTDNTAKMHRLSCAVRTMQIFYFITSSSTNLCSIKCNIDIHIIVLSTMI